MGLLEQWDSWFLLGVGRKAPHLFQVRSWESYLPHFPLENEETLPPAKVMRLWHKEAAPALSFKPELRLDSGQALGEPAKALYTMDL